MNIPEYIRERCLCEDECLIWLGPTNRGVPRIHLFGVKERLCRQILWEASGRAVRRSHLFMTPDCHPLCIEPTHQTYVSRKEARRLGNGAIDYMTRQKIAEKMRATVSPLNWDKVREIRRRRASGESMRSIARDMGIHHTTVYYVDRQKTWKEPSPFRI